MNQDILQHNYPATAESYIQMFRMLAAIIDRQLDEAGTSDNTPTSEGFTRRWPTLTYLAEGVETIASLRGDHGWNAPEGLSEYRHEMYQTEDYLRNKLIDLGYVYPRPLTDLSGRPYPDRWTPDQSSAQ